MVQKNTGSVSSNCKSILYSQRCQKCAYPQHQCYIVSPNLRCTILISSGAMCHRLWTWSMYVFSDACNDVISTCQKSRLRISREAPTQFSILAILQSWKECYQLIPLSFISYHITIQTLLKIYLLWKHCFTLTQC